MTIPFLCRQKPQLLFSTRGMKSANQKKKLLPHEIERVFCGKSFLLFSSHQPDPQALENAVFRYEIIELKKF